MEPAIRYFTQIASQHNDVSEQPRGKFEDFFHHHVLVVLGEPGLGKTTSFKEAAGHEQNTAFVRIGEFLNGPIEHLRGKVLYLDGLDEQRGRINGIDVMDALIGRLRSIDCPKVRISCRTADWHGENDLKVLFSVSPATEGIVELALEPLTEEDMRSFIEDAGDFVEGARRNKLDEFLKNPQTFLLLHDYYRKVNGWPANRTELLDGACKVLLQEPNENHASIVDDWVKDRELEQSSAYICAACLLSNVAGVSLSRHHADKSFPAIQELDDNIFSLKAVSSRRIFKPAGTKRVEPKHRMIAEYMAAKFLANRVRAGLSLGRVLALLTGIDGQIPADLRGVYAWLVSMLSGMADRILAHDPYGAIIYGDAYAWRPNTKRRALEALIDLSKKDPYFRHHDWSTKPLGGLSSPDMVYTFTEILKKNDGETHLLSVVLDAIANGPELPQMRDALFAFIRSPERYDYLKAKAITALFNACPKSANDLKKILDDICSGEIADKDHELRGTILDTLYPDTIGYEQIAEYLVEPLQFVFSSYSFFLKEVLLQKAEPDGLKILAKSLATTTKFFEKYGYDESSSVIGRLVRMLFERFGKSASTEEIFSWLSLGCGRSDNSHVRGEDADVVRKFIKEHSQVYLGIFEHFLSAYFHENEGIFWHWHYFLKLVLQMEPPHEFPRKLLEWMKQEKDTQKSHLLFGLACMLVLNNEPDLLAVPLEELVEISGSNSELEKIYSDWSKCNIHEWHWDHFEKAEQDREENRVRLAGNIETLNKHKVDVKKGKAINILIHFAQIWFALFSDLDRNAMPEQRLRQEAGDMAECLLTGFVASLQHEENFQSIEEIAKADKQYSSALLMFAGLDILAEKGKEHLLSLPDQILSLGFAYKITGHASDIGHQWMEWLWKERPDLVECVLDCCWRIQLAAGADNLTGFYHFPPNAAQLPIIIKILPVLLQDFLKAHPRILKSMLHNAIRYCPDKMPSLVQTALKKRFPTNKGQRTIWTAAGFLLDADQYFQKLNELMGKNEENKWVAYLFLKNILLERNQDGKLCRSINLRKQSIILLGSHFENKGTEFSQYPLMGERHESFAAQDIRELISSLEKDVSDDSAKALEALENTTEISQYHSAIKNARANQFRAATEAKFTYPDVAKVVATLANAEPANATDLKALVLDALEEIAKEIRHGNTDGWKTFWNLDKKNKYKPTDEHVDENTARDRLLEFLRPKLGHLNIVAEPEARYAEEKRADIAVYCKSMKLPVEIKRDDYKNEKLTIWSAAKEQLQKQYTRDPASEGNGIYLVFWFGGKGMESPPGEIAKDKPTTAKGLKKALLLTVSEQVKGLIDVCVIDVSKPESEKYQS